MKNNTDNEMWSWTLDMAIAAYLCPKPNQQIRNMARRYLATKPSKKAKSTLKTILKTSQPALLVKIAYDELTKSEKSPI